MHKEKKGNNWLSSNTAKEEAGVVEDKMRVSLYCQLPLPPLPPN